VNSDIFFPLLKLFLSVQTIEGGLFFVRFAIRCDSAYDGTRSLCGGFDHGSPNRNGSVCHSVYRAASAGQGNQ
jgi:hypothetical protein